MPSLEPVIDRLVHISERVAGAFERLAASFERITSSYEQRQPSRTQRTYRRGVRTRAAQQSDSVLPTELDRMRAAAALKKAGITKP